MSMEMRNSWQNQHDDRMVEASKKLRQAAFQPQGSRRHWENRLYRLCYITLRLLGLAIGSTFTLGAGHQMIAVLKGRAVALAPTSWHAYIVAGSGLWAVVASDFFSSLWGAASRDAWAFRLLWAAGSLCASLSGLFVLACRSERLLLELGVRCRSPPEDAGGRCEVAGVVLDLAAACNCVVIVADLVLLGLCCYRLLLSSRGRDRVRVGAATSHEKVKHGKDDGDEECGLRYLDHDFLARVAS